MNETDWFQSLDRATGDRAPRVDVVASVLADIVRHIPDRPDPFLRLLFATTGLAAAAVAAIAFTDLYTLFSDPALSLAGSVTWMVMQ